MARNDSKSSTQKSTDGVVTLVGPKGGRVNVRSQTELHNLLARSYTIADKTPVAEAERALPPVAPPAES